MDDINRRNLIAAATCGLLMFPAAPIRAKPPRFKLEPGSQGFQTFKAVHEGLGSIDVKIFDFGDAPAPANFLIYDIPAGASEGVHLHNLTDPKLGAFDEYYYIIEGRGRMTIDGEAVLVTAGDHVHAPLDSWRGIENIDSSDRLKVFLTYIDRTQRD
ncbi:cupin domain-containing protein [Sphingosinicella microcystinivorans]|uniref:Cupin domain n=1 Tax=Sphingosinicella microcystinivorans TaxID=335406 RepID=A0AAD1D5M5_SPHMI|nr:cupin domain-containing protein [Sphingosinicella microcystinivorans]RKS91368.1 cupin domain [Sphingosinicella microcystinivorans]BBE34341.1 hypothetical protein SmB9_19990 [Sphingosinicella microcystinivorans]